MRTSNATRLSVMCSFESLMWRGLPAKALRRDPSPACAAQSAAAGLRPLQRWRRGLNGDRSKQSPEGGTPIQRPCGHSWRLRREPAGSDPREHGSGPAARIRQERVLCRFSNRVPNSNARQILDPITLSEARQGRAWRLIRAEVSAIPSVLITSANRGLGLEFAARYLAANWRVYAACRHPQSAEKLQQLTQEKNDRITLMAMDATSAPSVARAAASLTAMPSTC